MFKLLVFLSSFIIKTITILGYPGVFLLMTLESFNFPIPSEVIMPYAGYLVSKGNFDFFWIVILGGLANLLGSLFSYYLGKYGGRPLILKYGRFFLVSKKDLLKGEKWINTYGEIVIFLGRLLPVVRTFISLPAGFMKMNIFKFSLYTFFGSLIWSWLFTFFGFKLGENWQMIEIYFKKFDLLIIVLIILVLVWFIRHQAQKIKEV